MRTPHITASSRAKVVLKVLFMGRDSVRVDPMSQLGTDALFGLRELYVNGFVTRTRISGEGTLFELTPSGNNLRFDGWDDSMRRIAMNPLLTDSPRPFALIGSRSKAQEWANAFSLSPSDWVFIENAGDFDKLDSTTHRAYLSGGPYSNLTVLKARSMGFDV